MALGSIVSKIASAAAKAAKKYSSSKSSSSSSSKSSAAGNRNSAASISSGYFDQNKDYAAAIKNTTDAAQRAQLIAERQNKLDWMNASGKNTAGYSNRIYNNSGSNHNFNSATPSFGGSSASGDATKGGAVTGNYDPSAIQAALATMEKNSQQLATANAQEQARLMEENQRYANHLKAQGLTPFQKNGKYYYTRQNPADSETEGYYSGDGSLSLPDTALLRQYQAVYNDAKARRDNAAMNAAHQMAEKLRDNYRYYPTQNSNGFGLGENNIGYIRDMTARVDELGNRYVDEYNKDSVTTKSYNADGKLRYSHIGGNVDAHKARVGAQMAQTSQRLAEQGKTDNTYAVRLSDPNDLHLSNAALQNKYATSGGIMNYNDSYFTAPQMAQAAQRENPAMTAGNGYESIASYLEQARNAQLQQTLAQLEQEKSQHNLNYDEIARQAYIASRQSQTKLPQQLAALGISGGGSESAQLGLATSYENNRNSNEQARQQMIQQLANSALQAKLQADSDIGGYYADAQKSALAAYQQQQAQQQAYDQWLQQFEYQRWQNSLDREWQQTQLNNSMKQYQDGLSQYELEMALKVGDYSKLAAAGYDITALMAGAGGKSTYSNRSSSRSAKSGSADENITIANTNGIGWVNVPGFGKLDDADLLKYVNSGAITETMLPDKNGNTVIYYTAKR